ncbi:YesL family protein [Aquibacillus koreensis]|uniref:YesL family protein n=1 Tax=Aquibacillus koreensis TaxID=279446 RepID=A0A9X4ALC1_9BACI|nr:YesL family protein [Aquibacillus koreensis]MCT2537028.1 YesL family protein [Aquibacillus koreensis]MDC3422318.1 YesL family protein [Aquibacillus koreensis]
MSMGKNISGSGKGMYRILEWIMWIAYVNLLWFGFSLLGLIVLGIFPATVAMYTVWRDLLIGKPVKFFNTFLHTFKSEFFKANLIGFVLLIVGYILYLDLQFLPNVTGAMSYVLRIGLIFVGILYIIALLYIFPVYVHFDLKFRSYFKQAILIGVFSPIMTIAMVVGLVGLYYLMSFLPGLTPLISASMISLITMGCALLAFKRLEYKQQVLKERADEKEQGEESNK